MGVRVISSAKINGYADSAREAAEALRAGRLVIFPTETVYGVAANAASPVAMRTLREFKQISEARPFTVHIADPADAAQYVVDAPRLLHRLARRAWPGPLTLVAEAPDPSRAPIAARFPEAINELYSDGTIGLRCPDHYAARELLRAADVPIVASSANRTSHPPPTDVQSAIAEMGEYAAIAVDGGPTDLRLASTVVRVRGEGWEILRKGAIDERRLKRMAVSEILFVCTGNTCRSPMAEVMFRAKLAAALNVSPDRLEAVGFRVSSAGIAAGAGAPISSGSLQALQARGLDGSSHISRPLTLERIGSAERIFGMTREHIVAAGAIAPGSAGRIELLRPGGPISDPVGGGPEEYAECAKQIESAVDARLKEILDEDRAW